MVLPSKKDHAAAVAEFERLAHADEQQHYDRLITLRDAIDAYEVAQGHEPDYPSTVAGVLELEMFKRHLKPEELAALLDVPVTRLREILRGKRGMNLDFARRLHVRLGIPGNTVLLLS